MADYSAVATMDFDTHSISSKVNTAISVLLFSIFTIFVVLIILLLIVISDTLKLNQSMERIHDLADAISKKHEWMLESNITTM